MSKLISRPTDLYSAMWPQYWAQNPLLRRGVGADGTKTPEELQAEIDAAAAENARLKAEMATFADELEKFKTKHSEAEKHRKEQEKLATKAAEDALKKSGDVDALEKSWQKKFDDAKAEWEAEMKANHTTINDLTVGAEASRMASELALDGSSDVLMPHIKSRLVMEMRDGKPTVKVTMDGKPTALTLADLKKEISENKAFAPVIKGSSASGPGPAGNKGDGNTGAKTMKRSEFDNLDPVERHNFVVKDKGTLVEG